MPTQRRTSPAALLTATALIGLSCGAFVISAPAATAATGTYTGTAAADLIHLNALNAPGTIDVADAYVAPVSSTLNSAGTPAVHSDATNASLNLLGSGAQNLVVEAHQTAPPDHATGVHDELLSVPAAPLLTATLTSADAHSRFNADGSCITGGLLSESMSKVADAALLPGAVPGTPAGDVLNLTGDKTAANPSGAAVSRTTIGLVKQPASAANYAVQTSSSTQITSVSLFGGQLVIEVVTAPKVVATATGVPGTSTVTLVQPVLKVNGTTYIAGQDLAPINIPGLPVIELSVGNLTKTISADGTKAEGHGNLLHLKLLSDPSIGTAADLTIGDTDAVSTAPAGGVNCSTEDPLRDVRKDTSATSVNAGQVFDYTITVPNRGSSDMTNVTVKDTVSGSPALVLVSSTPDPTSHSGNTYTFSLGTIAPNQVKTITMTFKVPSSAEVGTQYSNTAVITATYGGQTITKTVTTPYPVVDGPGAGPCDLSRSTKYASHLQVTPGENFNYYINLFNQGGQTCRDIVVKDVLDDGVSFVSCSDSCTHSGQTVTWTVSSLAPSDSKKLIVTVKTVATSGSLPNTADITPGSGTGGSPSTPGPTVGTSSVLAPDEPASRGTDAFAATGASQLVALLGTLLLGGALVMRRRAITA
jgi:uncharacterized repeat protein (TIGR01451 family)